MRVLAPMLCLLAAAPIAFSQPDLTHLRLKLSIDDRRQSVEGMAEFRYRASGAAAELSFGQRGLEFVKVESEPASPLDYQVAGDKLEVRIAGAAPGTPGSVRISYRAQPKQGLFFHRTVTETGVPVEQVWQFDAWEDWMPRPSDPDEQMTWELEAEVRPDWQVVSNGELLPVRQAGARRVFHWRQPVPARFEGFTFAAGNFETFEQRAHGRRFIHHVPAGVADVATVLRSLGRVAGMFEVFSHQFGPYPFGDYRQIILWDYHPQGTEHLGLACLSENKLIEERSRLDADDYIVAHELVHNWWHMLVAPRSRAHIWLSEGFAVYFGNQFFEAAEGRDEFDFRLRRRLRLYLEEDRKYRRVLVSEEPVPGGLDEHIYSKGAYILHMLRRWLGDERFFAGLRRFAEKHAWGRADSADFQRAMEEASGQRLDWYFRQWLYRKGYPVLRVSREWEEQAVLLRIEQIQDEPYQLPVRIEIVTDQGAEMIDETLRERVETRRYRLKGVPRYIRFDADHRLLAAVDFPRPSGELVRQLEGAADALGRIEAIETLASPLPSDSFEPLRRALGYDLFHGVRSAAAAALARLGDASVPVLSEALRRETDSRVLQNVVTALEPFAQRVEAQAALKRAAALRSSPYVRARALVALARARGGGVFELLAGALGENAHRDVVRAAAFQGFAALGDARAVPVIVSYLESDRTTRWAREPAVEALGRLAGREPRARHLLERIRDRDFWPGVREAARRALHGAAGAGGPKLKRAAPAAGSHTSPADRRFSAIAAAPGAFMASQKQIEANRRNALLATGPMAPEGEACSRLNAHNHGLTAEASVLPGATSPSRRARLGVSPPVLELPQNSDPVRPPPETRQPGWAR